MSTVRALPFTPTRPEFSRFEASKIVPFEQEYDNFDVFDDWYQGPVTASVRSVVPTYRPTPVLSSANVGVSTGAHFGPVIACIGSVFPTCLPTTVISSGVP
ncbi:hypothetical protein DPMN_031908 [Dreissena polymorpha]|uniref:Uncharacterized protein n=1 Tax=Dreissena polymorpha TaxID=45954 RepID=A0A9D4RHH5_DREPO|nr:hypothetical protein DPMN_031908 [Dreissena polymorpha]